MQQDKRLSDISERLQNLTIHEVRQLARALSVPFDSSHKPKIIEAVLLFAQGRIDPKIKVKGAPPKSDKHDEALAADVIAYRESVLSVDFNGKKEENLGVADGGAEVNFQKRVQGILYFEDDYYLRTEGGDVHVAQSFLSRYILRTGDVIEGVAQWREKDKAWALVLVEKVWGAPAEEGVKRTSFEQLTRIYPTTRILLAKTFNEPSCKITDMFAPLALGQRAVICSPAKCGKTTLLKKYAHSLKALSSAETVLLLLNAKPEEIADFRQFEKTMFYTSFNMSGSEHIREATLAFEYAKRKVERGENVIILADGLTAAGCDTVKKLTFDACCAAEGGSLTVIYTLPRNFSGYDELVDTANAVIPLSKELALSRIFPAIDAKACFSNREEELLDCDELAAANALRRGNTAENIIKLFSDYAYGDILRKYSNG